MKKNTFLKVMSIIMLICGILGAIISVIPAAISVLAAMLDVDFIYTIMLIAATVFAIVGAILQIVAGVKGLIACNLPAKIPSCIKLGIVIIALSVLSNVLSWIAPGGEIDIASLALNLVIPGLYVFSAKQ